MTPEQLEAIEGIGPKTVEKISLAVNNYFASLEGGEAVATEGEEVPAEEAAASEEAPEAREAAGEENNEETAEVPVAEEPGEEPAPAEAKEE
jgi:N utilization substance protein A